MKNIMNKISEIIAIYLFGTLTGMFIAIYYSLKYALKSNSFFEIINSSKFWTSAFNYSIYAGIIIILIMILIPKKR